MTFRPTIFAIRLTIPLALACLGLWLLAGCFYLPIPEHPSEKGIKDFRKLVGKADSTKPIRSGHISRAEVIALLGPAQFTSDVPPRVPDRSVIGYELHTESGTWVFPLCFSTNPDAVSYYQLKLTFDENDVLEHSELEDGNGPGGFPFERPPKLYPVRQP